MPKETVENTRKIDINWLMRECNHELGNYYYNRRIIWTREGIWGKSENSVNYDLDLINQDQSNFRLRYTSKDKFTNETTDIDYFVKLTATPCYFGGFRYWFICPIDSCHRRVATLYLNVTHFICRDCCDLSYDKRNTSKRYRELAKMFDYDDKAESLAKKIYGKNGRKFYKGEITKKYKKYLYYSSNDGISIENLLLS